MENNKFEKIIFTLLRVLGVITIIINFICVDGLFNKNSSLVIFKHKTIIGNVFMITPVVFTVMIVTIVLYLVFIRLLEKHISISKKSI